MKYIKNIFNDSKELTHKYIIFSIIHIAFLFLSAVKVRMYNFINLISLLLPLVYFIYIRTKSGKRNFNRLNKIVSILMMIGVLYYIYLFVSSIIPSLSMFGTLYSFYIVISYLLTICSSLYFILVFFVPEYKKVNIFKMGINEKIYMGLFIVYIIYTILYMVQLVSYGYYRDNILLYFINLIFGILESVLQIRYICLYQKFKEGRS